MPYERLLLSMTCLGVGGRGGEDSSSYGPGTVGSWIPTRARFDVVIEGDSQEKVCNGELEGKGQNPGIRRKWLIAS